MAMRYRARPAEIDAVEWTGDLNDLPAEWREQEALDIEDETGDLIVPTKQGPSHARVGDYVARCIDDGEMYPIARARFEQRWAGA